MLMAVSRPSSRTTTLDSYRLLHCAVLTAITDSGGFFIFLGLATIFLIH